MRGLDGRASIRWMTETVAVLTLLTREVQEARVADWNDTHLFWIFGWQGATVCTPFLSLGSEKIKTNETWWDSSHRTPASQSVTLSTRTSVVKTGWGKCVHGFGRPCADFSQGMHAALTDLYGESFADGCLRLTCASSMNCRYHIPIQNAE